LSRRSTKESLVARSPNGGRRVACGSSALSRPRANAWGHAIALLCLLTALSPALAGSSAEPGGLDELPPAERYRQMNLLLMVSEGISPGFLDLLQRQTEPAAGFSAEPGAFPLIDVDSYQTPLNRIVDQTALIQRATGVFRYDQAHHAEIIRSLEDTALAWPAEVATVDLVLLAEDAIIVRSALSGTFEYLLDADNPAVQDFQQVYRDRTVYLRNVMEFWQFNQELAALTDEAMSDTGGRMEAYQRMLDSETNLDSFNQHLQAVEHIYWQVRGGKGKPPKIPVDELIHEEAKVK